MNTPRATIQEVDGQLVLVDPDAAAIIDVVNQYNCKTTFNLNEDRIAHFKARMAETGKSPLEWVIVVLNVDDPNGGPLADFLMPDADWQQYRDRQEVPFARGIVSRELTQGLLDSAGVRAAEELRSIEGPAVVIMDHRTIVVAAA